MPSAGQPAAARRASARASRSRSAALAAQIPYPAHEDEAAAGEERERRAGRDEALGRELVGMKDLAVPVGGLIVRQEGPGQALDEVVDAGAAPARAGGGAEGHARPPRRGGGR